MSEERLQEIKDSIEFQYTLAKAKGYDNALLFTNEEEELVEEIERLNNIINGMEKFFQYAYDNEIRPLNDRKVSVWTICLDKLQELKGSGVNE